MSADEFANAKGLGKKRSEPTNPATDLEAQATTYLLDDQAEANFDGDILDSTAE